MQLHHRQQTVLPPWHINDSQWRAQLPLVAGNGSWSQGALVCWMNMEFFKVCRFKIYYFHEKKKNLDPFHTALIANLNEKMGVAGCGGFTVFQLIMEQSKWRQFRVEFIHEIDFAYKYLVKNLGAIAFVPGFDADIGSPDSSELDTCMIAMSKALSLR